MEKQQRTAEEVVAILTKLKNESKNEMAIESADFLIEQIKIHNNDYNLLMNDDSLFDLYFEQICNKDYEVFAEKFGNFMDEFLEFETKEALNVLCIN